MRQHLNDEKVHYKLYKDGKNWVAASIVTGIAVPVALFSAVFLSPVHGVQATSNDPSNSFVQQNNSVINAAIKSGQFYDATENGSSTVQFDPQQLQNIVAHGLKLTVKGNQWEISPDTDAQRVKDFTSVLTQMGFPSAAVLADPNSAANMQTILAFIANNGINAVNGGDENEVWHGLNNTLVSGDGVVTEGNMNLANPSANLTIGSSPYSAVVSGPLTGIGNSSGAPTEKILIADGGTIQGTGSLSWGTASAVGKKSAIDQYYFTDDSMADEMRALKTATNQINSYLNAETAATNSDIYGKTEIDFSKLKPDANGNYIIALDTTNWGKDGFTFKNVEGNYKGGNVIFVVKGDGTVNLSNSHTSFTEAQAQISGKIFVSVSGSNNIDLGSNDVAEEHFLAPNSVISTHDGLFSGIISAFNAAADTTGTIDPGGNGYVNPGDGSDTLTPTDDPGNDPTKPTDTTKTPDDGSDTTTTSTPKTVTRTIYIQDDFGNPLGDGKITMEGTTSSLLPNDVTFTATTQPTFDGYSTHPTYWKGSVQTKVDPFTATHGPATNEVYTVKYAKNPVAVKVTRTVTAKFGDGVEGDNSKLPKPTTTKPETLYVDENGKISTKPNGAAIALGDPFGELTSANAPAIDSYTDADGTTFTYTGTYDNEGLDNQTITDGIKQAAVANGTYNYNVSFVYFPSSTSKHKQVTFDNEVFFDYADDDYDSDPDKLPDDFTRTAVVSYVETTDSQGHTSYSDWNVEQSLDALTDDNVPSMAGYQTNIENDITDDAILGMLKAMGPINGGSVTAETQVTYERVPQVPADGSIAVGLDNGTVVKTRVQVPDAVVAGGNMVDNGTIQTRTHTDGDISVAQDGYYDNTGNSNIEGAPQAGRTQSDGDISVSQGDYYDNTGNSNIEGAPQASRTRTDGDVIATGNMVDNGTNQSRTRTDGDVTATGTMVDNGTIQSRTRTDGDVTANGNMVDNGTIQTRTRTDGDVTATGTMVDNGTIESRTRTDGDVTASGNMVDNGTIESRTRTDGDVTATGTMVDNGTIQSRTRTDGDVTATGTMVDNGTIESRTRTDGDVTATGTMVDNGTIQSRTRTDGDVTATGTMVDNGTIQSRTRSDGDVTATGNMVDNGTNQSRTRTDGDVTATGTMVDNGTNQSRTRTDGDVTATGTMVDNGTIQGRTRTDGDVTATGTMVDNGTSQSRARTDGDVTASGNMVDNGTNQSRTRTDGDVTATGNMVDNGTNQSRTRTDGDVTATGTMVDNGTNQTRTRTDGDVTATGTMVDNGTIQSRTRTDGDIRVDQDNYYNNTPSGDDGQTTTTTTPSGDDDQTTTTTTPSGDDGQTTTTTTPSGNDGQTTTTTPGGDDGQTTTTTTPSGDDDQTTTTTPSGNDGQTTTTTTPSGNDGQTTATPTPGGNDGQTTTTTTPGGDDGQTTTTTTPSGDDGQTTTTDTPSGDDGQTTTTTTPSGDDGQTTTTTTPSGDDGQTTTTTTPSGDDGQTTTTTPSGDDGQTTTTDTPSGDDGQTTTTTTPSGDDGQTTTTTTPSGDDGQTTTTTTPSGDDGQTTTPTTPSGNDGQTTTTTTPSGNDGQTTTTTTPSGNNGQTTTTTTPSGDDGQTTTTTTPSGNDGQTTTTTTPSGNNGQTTTTTTPSGDDGQTTTTQTPSGNNGQTTTTTTPSGNDDQTTTPTTPSGDNGQTPETTVTTPATGNNGGLTTNANTNTVTPIQTTTPTTTTGTTQLRTGNGLAGQTPATSATTVNPDGTTSRTLTYVDATQAPVATTAQAGQTQTPAANANTQTVDANKAGIPDQTATIADQTNTPAADSPAESVTTVANVIDDNAELTHGNIFIAGGAPGMADYTFFSQPVMDSSTNSVDHYELLLRVWDSKQGGWHLPASFSIPASMEAHLMARAVAQLDVKDISINLTDAQFEDPDTQKAITDLAQSDAVDSLTVELATIPDSEELATNAKIFQAAGVKVTLDNLGSHTDGTQLANAADHVDTLKVSLRGMRRDGNNLTQMTNQLAAWQKAAAAHNDSLEVEGLETPEDLAMTNDLGITAVQGYYFSRPAMPGTRADLM